MANNFQSNITDRIARVFMPMFENMRVLSKTVNTQLLEGEFNPSTGDRIRFKRPTDYRTVRTPDGDLTATTRNSIITGTAEGRVQDYFSIEIELTENDQSLKADQLEELLRPKAQRIVNDLETDFAKFMLRNSGLLAGQWGTPVNTWANVAEADAVAKTTGIPQDGNLYYVMNPYTETALADVQRSLGAGGTAGGLVDSAFRSATISENFGGMRVMTSTGALATVMTGTGADRAGTLSSDPDVTYVTAKDTMTQVLSVAGFQANLEVKAGEVVTIAGRNRLNLATRNPVVDAQGQNVVFTGVVTQDVTLSGTGTGNITISGPAIFETDGQYNTVDSAPVSGDVVTLGGAASTLYQPNLFYHREAFAIGSVPIARLNATDTIAQTKDGLQMRFTRDSVFRENKQLMRIDFRPAYGVLNPFFAGQGFGRP